MEAAASAAPRFLRWHDVWLRGTWTVCGELCTQYRHSRRGRCLCWAHGTATVRTCFVFCAYASKHVYTLLYMKWWSAVIFKFAVVLCSMAGVMDAATETDKVSLAKDML